MQTEGTMLITPDFSQAPDKVGEGIYNREPLGMS